MGILEVLRLEFLKLRIWEILNFHPWQKYRANQPSFLCSLVSTFIIQISTWVGYHLHPYFGWDIQIGIWVGYLESIVVKLAPCKISSFYLVTEAEHAGLGLTSSETPEVRFSRVQAPIVGIISSNSTKISQPNIKWYGQTCILLIWGGTSSIYGGTFSLSVTPKRSRTTWFLSVYIR